MTQPDNSTRLRLTAIILSLVVGAALMGMKFWAYHLTSSAAILSDALESIINVVAAGFALVSIIISARPPDHNHPYGHGKIEYFSAGFEGSLIILAAFGIIREAWDKIFNPVDIPELGMGLLLVGGAAVINGLMGAILLWTGKRTSSIVLQADGKHLITDVYTSVGVVIGLILVKTTGWLWMDGAVACLVALNILFMGFSIIRQAFSGLMDALDPKILKQIDKVIRENRKDFWIDVHKIRARQSGSTVHVDMHLTLPRDMRLWKAHDEVDKLERLLSKELGDQGDVIIHADPCTPGNCPDCDVDPCRIRERSSPEEH